MIKGIVIYLNKMKLFNFIVIVIFLNRRSIFRVSYVVYSSEFVCNKKGWFCYRVVCFLYKLLNREYEYECGIYVLLIDV